jgi:hypothetical protein
MVPELDVRKTLSRHWSSFLIFLIEFGFDTLRGLAIFTAFVLFARIIGLARAYGWGTEEHFKAYELAHFWLNYALYVSMGVAFLFRAIKALFV